MEYVSVFKFYLLRKFVFIIKKILALRFPLYIITLIAKALTGGIPVAPKNNISFRQ